MERTPGRTAAPVPHTPRRASDAHSRLPIRTPQPRTPRATLAPLEERENIPHHTHVLPRNKPADEVARLAEKLLDDLRKEKHALQNEREDLRTEIRTSHAHTELGRQRELKLRTQLDKQESMITRYKQRAAHMSKSHIDSRDWEESQQRRIEAEAEAEASAARCAELEAQLEEMHEQQEVEELLQTNMRCIARAAGSLAQRSLPSEQHWYPRPIVSITEDVEAREQLEATQMQRDALLVELDEVLAHVRHLYTRCDTLEEELDHSHTRAELDEDQLVSARLHAQCAASEAAWYASKLQMAEDRTAWLEAQLEHTQAVHNRVLAALQSRERSLKEEAQANVDAALEASRHNEARLHDRVLQLEAELDRVAWYEEAYAQRSRQADLLTEIATLADADARAQKIDSLTTHIAAMHDELQSLQSRHDELQEYNAHWERSLEGLDAKPVKRRRAVSDAGRSASHARTFLS